MEKSLVTVIIPAYNASSYISDTLESILRQSYRDIEIIVVDDGSTDDTATIVKSFSPRVTYIHQPNSGSCATPRNNGLQHAKGEFVSFFDADDLMRDDKIESQVNDLLSHPEAVATITNYWNFTETTRFSDHFSTCPALKTHIKKHDERSFELNSEECRRILIEENFSIASSPLFRTKVVRDLGGFDQMLKACEDFHLIYQAAMRGNVVINPNTGFDRRLHEMNMSSDNERMLTNLVKSRLSLMEKETADPLRKRLKHRAQSYTRALQSCLIGKGKIKEAIHLYQTTFPPSSIFDLKNDVKQLVKIFLFGIKASKTTTKP